MDQALVQYSQHDINGDQRGGDQDGLILQRVLIGPRGAGELAGDVGGQAHLHFGPVDSGHGIAQRDIFRQVEGNRGGRELPLVRQRNGCEPLRKVREGRQGDVGAFRRLHVDRLQEVRALPPLLLQGQNHVILTLAESVIERGVDGLRREAEARCGIAVDNHIGRQTGILLVGADVGNFRKRRKPIQKLRSPFRKRSETGPLNGVLVLCVALPAADAHVLGVLQEQGGSGHAGGLAAQTRDDLVRGGLANAHRFKLHVDIRRVRAAVSTAAGARHHSNGFDIGVHADLLLEPFRLVHQRLVGDVLLALHVALQAPGILLREKPFGDFVVKVDVNAQGN